MTVNELIRQLQALVADRGFGGDAAVAFGSDIEPLPGGIVIRNRASGLVVPNLAPATLWRVGGF